MRPIYCQVTYYYSLSTHYLSGYILPPRLLLSLLLTCLSPVLLIPLTGLHVQSVYVSV